MRAFFLGLCLLVGTYSAFSQPTNPVVVGPTTPISVTIYSNGVLIGYGANIFAANSNALNASIRQTGITAGNGGGLTNINALAMTNVVPFTNLPAGVGSTNGFLRATNGIATGPLAINWNDNVPALALSYTNSWSFGLKDHAGLQVFQFDTNASAIYFAGNSNFVANASGAHLYDAAGLELFRASAGQAVFLDSSGNPLLTSLTGGQGAMVLTNTSVNRIGIGPNLDFAQGYVQIRPAAVGADTTPIFKVWGPNSGPSILSLYTNVLAWTNSALAGDAGVSLTARGDMHLIANGDFVGGTLTVDSAITAGPGGTFYGNGAGLTNVVASGSGGFFTGTVNPEGSQVASPGAHYWRSDTGSDYVKNAGGGNTGWVLLSGPG